MWYDDPVTFAIVILLIALGFMFFKKGYDAFR